MYLHIAQGLEYMIFRSPFQSKPLHDSISTYILSTLALLLNFESRCPGQQKVEHPGTKEAITLSGPNFATGKRKQLSISLSLTSLTSKLRDTLGTKGKSSFSSKEGTVMYIQLPCSHNTAGMHHVLGEKIKKRKNETVADTLSCCIKLPFSYSPLNPGVALRCSIQKRK